MTEDSGNLPSSAAAQYYAWNRLVSVTVSGSTVTHQYDGRGIRIARTSGGVVPHYYYTPGWQCVEERTDALTTVERQFVWGLRYIDDLVLRDRSTANNGTINERRYAMQDGNWNTVAICDITGFVGERYAYSAYGSPVFMNGTGTVQASSPIGFETLYAGYRWDNATPQMYYVRNRFLLPQIGTWNRRDPLGYVDGMGLTEYVSSLPISLVDSKGLNAVCEAFAAHTDTTLELIDRNWMMRIRCHFTCTCTNDPLRARFEHRSTQFPVPLVGPFAPTVKDGEVTQLPKDWQEFEKGYCRGIAREVERELNNSRWCYGSEPRDPVPFIPTCPQRYFIEEEMTRERLRRRPRGRRRGPRNPFGDPVKPPTLVPIVEPVDVVVPIGVGVGAGAAAKSGIGTTIWEGCKRVFGGMQRCGGVLIFMVTPPEFREDPLGGPPMA